MFGGISFPPNGVLSRPCTGPAEVRRCQKMGPGVPREEPLRYTQSYTSSGCAVARCCGRPMCYRALHWVRMGGQPCGHSMGKWARCPKGRVNGSSRLRTRASESSGPRRHPTVRAAASTGGPRRTPVAWSFFAPALHRFHPVSRHLRRSVVYGHGTCEGWNGRRAACARSTPQMVFKGRHGADFSSQTCRLADFAPLGFPHGGGEL